MKERVGTRIAGTLACEEGLYRALRQMIVEAHRTSLPALINAAEAVIARRTQDSVNDDILVELALEAFRAVLSRLSSVAQRMVERVLQVEQIRHERRFIASANSAVGIDLTAVLARRGISEEIGNAMLRSASLIAGLEGEIYKRVSLRLLDLLSEGSSSRNIAKALAEEFGFSLKRAKFITRDQAATFTGELNRIRQTAAGITEYEWSTSLDERVRGNPTGKYPKSKPSHWHREGKRFKWSEPPEDGPPGIPINCRCVARPVFKAE